MFKLQLDRSLIVDELHCDVMRPASSHTAAVCLGHNTATLDDIVIAQVVVVHNVRYNLRGRKLTDGKLTCACNLNVYLWHGSFRITRSYIMVRALILFLPCKTESVDVIVDILDIELEIFRDISST